MKDVYKRQTLITENLEWHLPVAEGVSNIIWETMEPYFQNSQTYDICLQELENRHVSYTHLPRFICFWFYAIFLLFVSDIRIDIKFLIAMIDSVDSATMDRQVSLIYHTAGKSSLYH